MTTTHHHSDLAASPLAGICGARKIIGRIKIQWARLKGREIKQHFCSRCACEACSSEIPVCVQLVQELSYLTKQMKIRTSYLCLTALHIPEGDHLSEYIQQPGIQSNQSRTICTSIYSHFKSRNAPKCH